MSMDAAFAVISRTKRKSIPPRRCCVTAQTVGFYLVRRFGLRFFVTGMFRFLSGEPKTYVKIADSGNERVLAFCPQCGTPVYSKPL